MRVLREYDLKPMAPISYVALDVMDKAASVECVEQRRDGKRVPYGALLLRDAPGLHPDAKGNWPSTLVLSVVVVRERTFETELPSSCGRRVGSFFGHDGARYHVFQERVPQGGPHSVAAPRPESAALRSSGTTPSKRPSPVPASKAPSGAARPGSTQSAVVQSGSGQGDPWPGVSATPDAGSSRAGQKGSRQR